MAIQFDKFFALPPRPNYKKIAAAACGQSLSILQQILPGGRLAGLEYVVRNPKRPDRNPGSFKINTRTGRWADFATGDSGGDLISLLAYIEDIYQSEAARRLAKMLHIDGEVL
jgi:putative DNA primase/helicase